jgi:hypothetical protein
MKKAALTLKSNIEKTYIVSVNSASCKNGVITYNVIHSGAAPDSALYNQTKIYTKDELFSFTYLMS